MKELLIGDMHFGIKSNSTNWLESQIEFITKQIYEIIDNEDLDRIVFLGDLFDVRYSVNQQIGIEVKNMIRDLATKFSKPIFFVAGNHDYYSPLEEFDKYNAYELVFGPEFIKCYPNLKFITKEPYFEDGSLFLPWYYTENPTHFDDILYSFNFDYEVKAIYCHADLSVWPGGRIASLRGVPVYSGHIHYIIDDPIGNLHNLGAAAAFTFNDVNQDRFVYILENYKIVKKIANVVTPSFKRIYNENIFTVNEDMVNNTYLQLCVAASNINKANYIEQIKYIKSTYTDANISVHVVDDDETADTIITEGFNTNIHQYIETNIPNHLTGKYDYIRKKLTKETNDN